MSKDVAPPIPHTIRPLESIPDGGLDALLAAHRALVAKRKILDDAEAARTQAEDETARQMALQLLGPLAPYLERITRDSDYSWDVRVQLVDPESTNGPGLAPFDMELTRRIDVRRADGTVYRGVYESHLEANDEILNYQWSFSPTVSIYAGQEYGTDVKWYRDVNRPLKPYDELIDRLREEWNEYVRLTKIVEHQRASNAPDPDATINVAIEVADEPFVNECFEYRVEVEAFLTILKSAQGGYR